MAEAPTETPAQPRPAQATVPRPRRSFARRMANSFRAWARNAFEREQIISALKSLAWVAPMTAILWIYAERDQATQQLVQFRIEARNNDPHRLVELRAVLLDGRVSSNFVVSANISGPNGPLEREKEKLQSGGALQIDIPPDQPSGQFSLAVALANDPTLKEAGLTPTNIVPSQVEVIIDQIVTESVPVVAHSNASNVDGPVHFQPAAISVTGPKRVLDAARKDGRLVVNAELPPLTDPGPKSEKVNIGVAIDDPHVQLAQATVQADYTLKTPNVSGVLHGVAVLKGTPAGDEWEKYKFIYDPTIPELPVTGPAAVIAEVDRVDYPNRPLAILNLSRVPTPLVPGRQYTAPLYIDLEQTGLKTEGIKMWNFHVEER